MKKAVTARAIQALLAVLHGWRSGFALGLRATRAASPLLTVYQRFEQVVLLALTGLISALVVVALVHLTVRILLLILSGRADPAQQEVFQSVFGMVMTVLIALEFNHSMLGVLERRHGVVQVRTVVLIALLAVVRKFIVVDAAQVMPVTIMGLAASALALGAVYWLVREQDWREDEERPALADGIAGSPAQRLDACHGGDGP
jgi:uncharacterized membrane protein (DUF373 family)